MSQPRGSCWTFVPPSFHLPSLLSDFMYTSERGHSHPLLSFESSATKGAIETSVWFKSSPSCLWYHVILIFHVFIQALKKVFIFYWCTLWEKTARVRSDCIIKTWYHRCILQFANTLYSYPRKDWTILSMIIWVYWFHGWINWCSWNDSVRSEAFSRWCGMIHFIINMEK